MVTEATGFDFFLAHQGVVYGALARLGIHRGRSDFQDWRDEGMLVYLNYFNRYREPLVDETAIAKFNKLAWRFVFLTMMQRLQKAQHRRELENVPANTTHIQTTTLAMAAADFAGAQTGAGKIPGAESKLCLGLTEMACAIAKDCIKTLRSYPHAENSCESATIN